MIDECEHFTVLKETEDFAWLGIKQDGTFRGHPLSPMNPAYIADFFQFLMDEKNLAVLGSNGRSMVVRKLKECA